MKINEIQISVSITSVAGTQPCSPLSLLPWLFPQHSDSEWLGLRPRRPWSVYRPAICCLPLALLAFSESALGQNVRVSSLG